jgi:hypothetical protein
MKKICHTCGIEKELDSFYKRSGTKDQRQTSCKICMKISQLTYKDKKKVEKEEMVGFDYNALNLIGTCKDDYCQMYSFLSKIGYNPELDIHLQFCEKWGISTYKERVVKNKNKHTYDDCKE